MFLQCCITNVREKSLRADPVWRLSPVSHVFFYFHHLHHLHHLPSFVTWWRWRTRRMTPQVRNDKWDPGLQWWVALKLLNKWLKPWLKPVTLRDCKDVQPICHLSIHVSTALVQLCSPHFPVFFLPFSHWAIAAIVSMEGSSIIQLQCEAPQLYVGLDSPQ